MADFIIIAALAAAVFLIVRRRLRGLQRMRCQFRRKRKLSGQLRAESEEVKTVFSGPDSLKDFQTAKSLWQFSSA